MKGMILDNEFDIAETVYLKTDGDQLPRIVTSIGIRPSGILYELSCGCSSSSHYDFEISRERSLVERLKTE